MSIHEIYYSSRTAGKRNMCNRRARYGFSLVELLIGTIVASVIGACLFQLFDNGVKLYEKAHQIHRVDRQALAFFRSLEQDLSRAMVYQFHNSYPDLVSFEGTRQGFRLIEGGHDGLEVMTYRQD